MEGGFGTLLTLTLALHLMAAGAWLGSLVPLALLLRDAPQERPIWQSAGSHRSVSPAL